jgi:hypothetical protein
MRVAVLNGSPKTGPSASRRIISWLAGDLGQKAETIAIRAAKRPEAALAEAAGALEGAGALVIVSPLYVDSLPSTVLGLLEALIPRAAALMAPGARVHAAVNCGFWEPEQNELALEQLRLFAAASNLAWGRGLAVGGGGALTAAPAILLRGHRRAVRTLAGDVLSGSTGPDLAARLAMPRGLYCLAANVQWRWLAWREGLPLKDLDRRPWG